MYLVCTICIIRKNRTKALDEPEINNPYQNNLACVDSRGTNMDFANSKINTLILLM